jgi:hypothetical protein
MAHDDGSGVPAVRAFVPLVDLYRQRRAGETVADFCHRIIQ